jgi:hypothetical protein
MHFKPDWTEAKERLCRWWAGEDTDRVVALVTAPRGGAARRATRDVVPDKYTDRATVLQNLDAALDATFYGGEAIPAHWVYLGPVPLSGYMGCEMHFRPDTVWHARRFDSWDEASRLAFDPSNRWYRLLCDLTRASVERARGAYLVSGQGFGCVSDVIADLWGSEETLLAMLERPDAVAEATRRLVGISETLYDEVHALCAPYQEGSFDWLYLWAPGRMWTLQSDLCCMISPQCFRDFVLEELREEAEHVDHAFYHLDGPGAVQHLDDLLGIEALDGIQWVPGAGASQDPMDWLGLFRRVQAAGKKLYLYCPPERVEPLLARISRSGVCLSVGCADQSAAEDVLRALDRIGM